MNGQKHKQVPLALVDAIRIYNRRADIHARYGGQQQGGIITPSQHPVVIVITGEEGIAHGYTDRYRPDGVFEYFGEGQVGDMRLRAGNRTIAEHSVQGRGLLLFKKTGGGLRFEGEMICQGHHYESASDRAGATRNAIVFELRVLEAVAKMVEEERAPSGMQLTQLRQLAFSAASQPLQAASQATRTVLARASGNCEGCGAAAPFYRTDGTPWSRIICAD